MLKKAINTYPFMPLWYIEKLEKEKEKNYKFCLSLLFVLLSILLIFNYSYNNMLKCKEEELASIKTEPIKKEKIKESNIKKGNEIMEHLIDISVEDIEYYKFGIEKNEIKLDISSKNIEVLNKYVNDLKVYDKINLSNMKFTRDELSDMNEQYNINFELNLK